MLLALTCLFFFSGAGGLILEVIWTRRLALVFGSTIESASTTTAVFMLGLGIGAVASGRLSSRVAHRLRLFGALEVLVAATAWATTQLIPHVAPLAAAWSQSPLFGIVRFLLVAALLLVPCALMGATLPVLAQLLTQQRAEYGRVLAFLYAANTLGAACGAFATDHALVEHLGVPLTASLAVGLDLTVGLVALVASTVVASPPAAPADGGKVRRLGDLAWILALTGFCAMAFEILWTRVLIYFDGSDARALSTVLSVYLVGLVAGSAFHGAVLRRVQGERRRTLLAGLLIALGLSGFAGIFIAASLGPLQVALGKADHRTAGRLLADLVLMGVPTFCLGTIFPLTADLVYDRLGSAGASTGQAYLWNVLGSLCGALLTGFVLIGHLGVQLSLIVTAAIATVLGAWVSRSVRVQIVAVLAVVAMFLTPPTLLMRTLLGPVKVAGLQAHAEDAYGFIALIRERDPELMDDVQNLEIDGFNMMANGPIAGRYASLLSLAPIALHPQPERVLVVGLGLGNTATAAVRSKRTAHVTVVELSPRVVDVVRHVGYIRETLSSEKIELVYGDGRNFLLNTRDRFDVITAEPPPPTHAGIVNLYSREYYELCRARLRPGGRVAQWLPVFQLSPFESKVMIKAFQEVFPHTYLLQGVAQQLILVGSLEPFDDTYAKLRERNLPDQALFESLGVNGAAGFAGLFLHGPQSLREYTADVPPLTDDHPYIEYHVMEWPRIDFLIFGKDRASMPFEVGEADKAEVDMGWLSEHKLRIITLGRDLVASMSYLEILRLSADMRRAWPSNGFYRLILLDTDAWRKERERKAAESPQDTSAQFEVARLDFLDGRLDDATRRLKSIPGALSIGLRGLIAEETGDRSGARALYQEAMKADADDATRSYLERRLKDL